jgi:hypothetical protein
MEASSRHAKPEWDSFKNVVIGHNFLRWSQIFGYFDVARLVIDDGIGYGHFANAVTAGLFHLVVVAGNVLALTISRMINIWIVIDRFPAVMLNQNTF